MASTSSSTTPAKTPVKPAKLTPLPPADIDLVSMKVRKMFPQALKDINSTEVETRAMGAQVLKQLADSGTEIDSKFMALQGALHGLVPLLQDDLNRGSDIAIKAIVAISKKSEGNIKFLRSEEHLPALLVHLLKYGTEESKVEACKLVQGLGAGNAEITVKLAQTEGLLATLVDMLSDKKQIAEKASRGVWFFCMNDSTIRDVCNMEGVVEGLLFQVQTGTNASKEKALAALWRMCCTNDSISEKLSAQENGIEHVWLTAMNDSLPDEIVVVASKLMVVLSKLDHVLNKYESFKVNPPKVPEAPTTAPEPKHVKSRIAQVPDLVHTNTPISVEDMPQVIAQEEPVGKVVPAAKPAAAPAARSAVQRPAPAATSTSTSTSTSTTTTSSSAAAAAPASAVDRKQAIAAAKVARGVALPDHLKEKMKAATKKGMK